jgi:hypothetical protein
MKHIFLVLIFCIACTPPSITQKASDREHDGFVGRVKKVYVEWSPISGGNYPVGSRCREMTKVYDLSGRLMQHSLYFGACGGDEIRNDYSYAPDGSRTEKSQEIRGKDSPPPPPPIASRSQSEEEKGEPRMIFKYDPSSGKEVEDTEIRPSGRIVYKSTYSYDDKGRMIEMTSYGSDGQVSNWRVYGYSGNERGPSSFAYYDGKGNVHERTTYSDYEFNSQGDWIRRKETRVESFNRRSVSSTVRQIEYYPNGK